jgi:hypothetical protein
MVPATDTTPLVRETTISSETRTVMANKIKVVKLRKYLRPDDSRDLIKDNILPFNMSGATAEFAFYFQKMLFSTSITRRTAVFLRLLIEPTDLPNPKHGIRACIW